MLRLRTRLFDRWMAPLAALTLCAAPLGLQGAEPPPAPTLEAGAPALAESRYRMGRNLYTAGDWQGAVREFRGALDIFPGSAKLAFNLGRSFERLNDVEGALEAYRRYLQNAPDAPDREDMVRLVAGLERRLDETNPVVTVTSEPPGAEIWVDDASAPLRKTPVSLRLTPGTHILRLRMPGYRESTRPLAATRGEATALHLALEAEAKSGVAATRTPEPPTESHAAPRWVGWTLVGLGGASLVVAALYGYDASEAATEAEGLGRSPDEFERRDALRETHEFDLQMAWGTGAVGAGLTLAGAAFLLIGAKSDAGVGVSPLPGGFVAGGRF